MSRGKKKKFKGVNTYILLCCIMVVMALLTYIVPAGQYDMIKDPNSGRLMVDSNTFHYVAQNPTSFFDLFRAIPKGMISGASIIFFIFIIAGSIQIINKTGAINSGIFKLTKLFKGKEIWLIPIFMIAFSLTGAFLGFSEENLVFVPLTVSLAVYLGYDGIVGMSISYLATQVGFFSAMMNPFSVGVAHEMAQLPLFSGMGVRFLCWAIFIGVTIWYVMSYAKKIKKNPELSLVSHVKHNKDELVDFSAVHVKLTKSHKIIYLLFLGGIFTIMYGTYNYKWGVVDIAATFLCIGLFSGLIGKLNFNAIADEFVAGARSIIFGALVVGFAKAIYVVMNDGMIVATIVHCLAGFIRVFHPYIAILGIFAMQWLFNILIPSATGQAAVSMPIMIPLADALGIKRQVAVLAFQFGDGFNNSLIPTSSTMLAACTIAKVPYDRWFRFLWKLVLIWTALGAVILMLADNMGYGPF